MPSLSDIRRIRPTRGDIVVVSAPDISTLQAKAMAGELAEYLPDGVGAIVLASGLKLTVLDQGQLVQGSIDELEHLIEHLSGADVPDWVMAFLRARLDRLTAAVPEPPADVVTAVAEQIDGACHA